MYLGTVGRNRGLATSADIPISFVQMLFRINVGLLILLFASTDARGQDSDSGATDDIWAGTEEMVVRGSAGGGVLADIARSNSVTAFNSEDLAVIGAADISDLANFTPNLEIVVAGSTSPTFFIRGIGLNDFNANAAGAVAIYQDDVPLNSPAIQLGSLFDVENAAVLRGPQGTGPYRNASAGSVKVYSKKPTGDFGVTFKAELGNYDARDFEGSLQFPITNDTLWARISFRSTTREGTFKNRCAGAPPREGRPVRITLNPFEASHCGEFLFFGEASNVDANQPTWLNSRNNWALRGVFLFQPDVQGDVEMDWLVTARGSRRDEPSFVGQSIGTNGIQRYIDPETGEETRDPIFGILGGTDFGRYSDPDVIQQRQNSRDALDAKCAPCTPTEIRANRFHANNRVASHLARELDSNPYRGNISHSGGTTNDTYGVSLKGSIEFGDLFELTTISGYDHWQRRVDLDLDFTSNTQFETDSADDGWQVFQELRLDGQSFDGLDKIFGGPLDWEIGGFVLNESLHVSTDVNFGTASGLIGAPRRRTYRQKVLSLGGYASFSWDFWDAFTIDGGVRFNWERRTMDDYRLVTLGPPDLEVDEEFTGQEPTGTIRLTYRPTEDSSVYIKYTHGWKSGTFNATGNRNLGVVDTKPEEIDAFEAGLRGSYFGNRLNLGLSIFHYAYQEYQLFTSLSAFRSPPQFVIVNASDVELYGSEVEATLMPWEGGLVDVKFSWLEGEFLEFVRTSVGSRLIGGALIAVPIETDQSGNRLLNAPRYTITMSLQQAFPIGHFGSIVARWDGLWKDTTYFDSSEGRGLLNAQDEQLLPKNTIGMGPHWIHNVRLAYLTPDESIDVALWVRNVTDEAVKAFSADLTAFQKTTLHFVGDPRTFGVTTSIRF